jgi:hypothetical protein
MTSKTLIQPWKEAGTSEFGLKFEPASDEAEVISERGDGIERSLHVVKNLSGSQQASAEMNKVIRCESTAAYLIMSKTVQLGVCNYPSSHPIRCENAIEVRSLFMTEWAAQNMGRKTTKD